LIQSTIWKQALDLTFYDFSRYNLDTIALADYCTAMQDAIRIALEGSSDFINVIPNFNRYVATFGNSEPEQTEALPLVVNTPKKKRTKVTLTHVNNVVYKYICPIVGDTFNLVYIIYSAAKINCLDSSILSMFVVNPYTKYQRNILSIK